MKTWGSICLMTVIALTLVSCSIPVTKVEVQSFEIKKQGIDTDQAVAKMSGIFVDRGFDIKMSNKDAGIVTTEYKKFTSVGGDPPFDYYMQIKAKIKIAGGNTSIALSPIVKEQNRMNAAAFTEHELSYYTGNPSNVRLIKSMRPETGWRVLGQTLFMNVVTDTAETFGLSTDQVIQNVTNTPANALGAD